MRLHHLCLFVFTPLGFLAASLTPQQASASCGFIKDSDAKALCRAQESKSSGQCGFIKDSDKRAYCRAVTGSGSSHCGFIKNMNLRNTCRSEAR